MIEYIKTFLKIALHLIIGYGILIFFTNQFNPIEWGTTAKIISVVITIGVIRVNLDKTLK